MTTLAIETSTTSGGVAVLRDGEMLLEESFLADRSHSAVLFAVLERAVAVIDGGFDLVAIGVGPGSFAGVRIAIAAGLGIQMALGGTMVGVPSVAVFDDREYLAIGDARRETFYFSHVRQGVCLEGPMLVTEDELHTRLAGTSLPILGTEELKGFPNVQIATPLAGRIARLAATDRGVVSRGDLEPIYLREPHITLPRVTVA